MVWLIKKTDLGWRIVEFYPLAFGALSKALNDKESLERSARKAGFKTPEYKVVGELI